MLEFDESWRFSSPGEISTDCRVEISELIAKIAKSNQSIFELFKKHFAATAGTTSNWSSNLSWAESDLYGYLTDSSQNAPLFIEAFYDACEELRSTGIPVPAVQITNKILAKHEMRFQIDPPKLIDISAGQRLPMLTELPISMDQRAKDVIFSSMNEADNLLQQGNYKQAVQEILWLLESVTTVYKGTSDSGNNTIQGKYFNKIIGELSRNSTNGHFRMIIKWIENLHGYLSAPAGGGIRHGMDLKEGIELSKNEAVLFCHQTASYINYLLAEYDKIVLKKI